MRIDPDNSNKKLLIYTTVTNDTVAFSCAQLLYKSLKKFLNIDFDFQIAVPESHEYHCPNELKDLLFPIYNNHYKNTHIVTLRYNNTIFNQSYDYFTYMDSDILWMIPQIFNLNYNHLCSEPYPMKSKNFSGCWRYNVDQKYIHKLCGINAGFFGLKKHTALELSQFMIRNLYSIKKFRRAMIEQNLFNLFIYNEFLNNQVHHYQDIGYRFVLGAQADTVFKEDMSYHFYGNMFNMNDKLDRMSKFLQYNNIKL